MCYKSVKYDVCGHCYLDEKDIKCRTKAERSFFANLFSACLGQRRCDRIVDKETQYVWACLACQNEGRYPSQKAENRRQYPAPKESPTSARQHGEPRVSHWSESEDEAGRGYRTKRSDRARLQKRTHPSRKRQASPARAVRKHSGKSKTLKKRAGERSERVNHVADTVKAPPPCFIPGQKLYPVNHECSSKQQSQRERQAYISDTLEQAIPGVVISGPTARKNQIRVVERQRIRSLQASVRVKSPTRSARPPRTPKGPWVPIIEEHIKERNAKFDASIARPKKRKWVEINEERLKEINSQPKPADPRFALD